MYILNEIIRNEKLELLGVNTITFSENFEELEEFKKFLEKNSNRNIYYEIVVSETLNATRDMVGCNFDKLLYTLLNNGIDIEEQYYEDCGYEHLTKFLPIDISLEKENELILTFENGKRKLITIKDMLV